MLYPLNRQRLLVRDIENFSKGNSFSKEKKENIFVALLKHIGKTFAQLATSIQLTSASRLLKRTIKNDYKRFLAFDEREKENVLIKWEGLYITLNEHFRNSPTASGFLTKSIINKSKSLLTEVNDFTTKLEAELYPCKDQPMSQEYLRGLAKKFEHLPKEMLEDLVSDEHTELV